MPAPDRPASSALPTGSGCVDQPRIHVTSCEAWVVHLMAMGLSVKRVAKLRQVSPNTIKFHKKNLYKKLGNQT
jgi:DNA-binding NarL/FixJ family response regulator